MPGNWAGELMPGNWVNKHIWADELMPGNWATGVAPLRNG